MHSALIFVFSSLASFIGSLQLGPVNLFVIDSVGKGSKTNAYWVALGGVVPEFIYCALAVYSGALFLKSPLVLLVIKILLIIVLIGMAWWFLFKKAHSAPPSASPAVTPLALQPGRNFIKGFSLAALNPQLWPFWLFMLVWFNSMAFTEVKSGLDKAAYIAGSGIGALALLIAIIETVTRYRTRLATWLNHKFYNKALAWIFFAIALHQLITLL